MIFEKLKRITFDLLAAGIGWTIFFYYRKNTIEEIAFEITETLIIGVLVVSLFWVTLYTLAGTYIEVRRVSRLNELQSTIKQTLIGCLIIFFVLIIDDIENYKNYKFYYQSLGVLMASHFSLTFFTRYIITSKMVYKIHNREIGFQTILIGDPATIINTRKLLENMRRSEGNKIMGYINTKDNQDIPSINLKNLGTLDELENIIITHKIEEAIITVNNSKLKNINSIINKLIYLDIITKITPNLADFFTGKVKMKSLYNMSLIEIQQIRMSFFESCLKRIIDIVLSIIAIILLSPIMLLMCIIIPLTSKGPIFYLQERIGHKGSFFNIIKFRSMKMNSEKNGPKLSSLSDKRITRIGKIMRKYRIDELPQFYNVLVGEMSLVGPRPERMFFAKQILQKAPHYKLVQKVKPGITSWGMVQYGYAENVDEMIKRLKYDIIYLENLSIMSDIKVLIFTIFIILQGRGK